MKNNFDLFDLIVSFGDGSESILIVTSGKNWESHITPEGYFFGPNAIEDNYTTAGWAEGVTKDASFYGGIKSIEIINTQS